MIRMQARFLTDRGEPALALTKVINQRITELGESQRNAVVATAITILKSLRALTKVAKLGSFKGQWGKVTGQYVASFERRGDKCWPCIRLGGRRGTVVRHAFVKFLTKEWKYGQEPDVFIFNDSVGKRERKSFFVVSRSAAEAKKYASEKHKDMIKHYRGLAKFAIGYAMGKVSTRSAVASGATAKARAIGVECVKVKKSKQGSTYTIDVADNLDFAAPALKGGEAAVAIAERRACNSVVGYINSALKRAGSVRKPLKIPFPPGGI
jgi:hypothetical protein